MTRVRRSDRPPFLSPRTPLPGGPVSRFNNLRLAYRLGIAFGVVIFALVVVAVISATKMSALDADSSAMADHDVVSIERVLTVQQRMQRAAYLATSHLYVHEGDLAAQDAIAKPITALTAADDKDFATLATSIDDPAARTLLGKYKAASGRFASTYATAIRRSRGETVANVEERDGSRDYFTSTVLPAEAGASK